MSKPLRALSEEEGWTGTKRASVVCTGSRSRPLHDPFPAVQREPQCQLERSPPEPCGRRQALRSRGEVAIRIGSGTHRQVQTPGIAFFSGRKRTTRTTAITRAIAPRTAKKVDWSHW